MKVHQIFASLPHTFPTAASRRKFTFTEGSVVGRLSQRKVYASICVKENSRLFEEIGGSWNLKIYRLYENLPYLSMHLALLMNPYDHKKCLDSERTFNHHEHCL
jgi:hypothetical protein